MGPNFTNQKQIDENVMRRISKYLDAETPIISIDFRDPGDFTKTMTNATIEYYSLEDKEVKRILIPLQGNQKPNHLKVRDKKTNIWGTKSTKTTPENSIKLKDMNFSQIASNIQKGVDFLKEESMSFDGIRHYTITVDLNTLDYQHRFTLESKSKTELSTESGRLVTSYYKIGFTADSEGNVEYVK